MGLVVLSMLLVGCASPHARFGARGGALLGEWVGQGPGGNVMTYEFHDDSTMLWRLPADVALVPLELHYTYNPIPTPSHLDVWGFETGPLAGRALYGIVQFTGRNTFKLDFEPGPMGDDSGRITEFGNGTSKFVRK
jgi:hypothetical protein